MRRPHEPRGAGDPAGTRAAARLLKDRGLVGVPSASDPAGSDWPLPHIVSARPRPGCRHPAGKADIARVLRALGEECVYGIRAIELRQGGTPAERLLFGRLLVPGRVLLFDQLPSPWRLAAVHPTDATRLERAGAILGVLDGAVRVDWPGESLRDFFLFDVLLHEIGHHLLQHHKGKRPIRIARTRDHESFAETFARVGRERYARLMGGP